MTYPRNPIYDKWQQHIEHWLASGLSQPKYCEQNNLNYTQFKYFRNRLRDVDYAHNIVATQPISKTRSVPTFEPVQMKATMAPAPMMPASSNMPQIKIIHPSGIQIECSASLSANQLKSLIEVMKSC